jgi:hypothetical protein
MEIPPITFPGKPKREAGCGSSFFSFKVGEPKRHSKLKSLGRQLGGHYAVYHKHENLAGVVTRTPAQSLGAPVPQLLKKQFFC